MWLPRLKLPIIQAPMAGGINTVPFVIKAMKNGIVGSFGFAYSSPQLIREQLKQAKDAEPAGLLNANFFIFEDKIELPSNEQQQKILNQFRSFPLTKEIKDEVDWNIPKPPFIPNLNELLEPIWENPPTILSFHFGLPSSDIINQAKKLGISVGATATSLQEAKESMEAGVDFIVAQGIEAGGHRGTFIPNDPLDKKLTIDQLLIELKDQVSIPIIAAGGIMNGEDIFRVMKLGANAAQMGTVFLTCTESGASAAHKRYLLEEKDRGTAYTKSFTGRQAQGINNEFIELTSQLDTFQFPIQHTMTSGMRKIAQKYDQGEYQSMWAGTKYRKCKEINLTDLLNQIRLDLKLNN